MGLLSLCSRESRSAVISFHDFREVSPVWHFCADVVRLLAFPVSLRGHASTLNNNSVQHFRSAMSAPTTLSRPHPTVWQISLSSPPDNRLTPTLLASLDANLDIVEAEWRRSGGGVSLEPKKRGEHGGAGALIITSSIGKFFSNGLDYEKSSKDNNFFPGESRHPFQLWNAQR